YFRKESNRNVIRNCHVKNNGDASDDGYVILSFRASGGSGNNVTENKISGNQVESNSKRGIEVHFGDKHIIQSNHCIDNTNVGIQLNEAGNGYQVLGNNCSASVPSGQGSGITLTFNVNGAVVAENICRGNGTNTGVSGAGIGLG